MSDIYDDTPVTEVTVDATEKPMQEAENLFVPTVRPGPKSKTFDPQPTNDDDTNLLLNGLNIPIYFIILICVGFGLLLWIAAWIGWSCRKCCQAQKDKDERYIRNEIFGEKHRQQTDPLPIPDSGVIYKQQPGAALARIGDVASSQETIIYQVNTIHEYKYITEPGTPRHQIRSRLASRAFSPTPIDKAL